MYWIDNNTGISTAPTPPAVISLIKKYFTNGGAGEQPSIPEDFWFNMIQEELLGVLTMAGIAPVKGCSGQEKLATVLCSNQNNRSDSFGVRPPL